jgi:hypothetical protein
MFFSEEKSKCIYEYDDVRALYSLQLDVLVRQNLLV